MINGNLLLWGQNAFGQLGINSTTDYNYPVEVLGNSIDWAEIDAGLSHFASIKKDGTLWLWGDNKLGQIGTNTDNDAFSSPIQTIMGGNYWTRVHLGKSFSAAIENSILFITPSPTMSLTPTPTPTPSPSSV